MAQCASSRPLNLSARAGLRIELARPEDESAIRRLLREAPLQGDVCLSFEREPDARIAEAIEGERHHTVLVRETATGRVVGMGSRVVRRVWLGGEPVLAGYVGLLRRDPRRPLAGRALAEAFAALDATRRPDELPWDLTSIVADNVPARRLLERRRAGLPQYRPVGRLRTWLFPSRQYRSIAGVVRGTASDLPDIAGVLRRSHASFSFAPVWTEVDLRNPERCRGLQPQDFRLVRAAGEIAACAALWDQRSFKQVVVRGYAARIARWRHLLNLAFALSGHPRLPAAGGSLEIAYLSHIAVDAERPGLLIDLVRAARDDAARRGVRVLAAGFPEDDPLAITLTRSVRCRNYSSLLYVVRYPGGAPIPKGFPEATPRPEIAVL